MTRILVLAALPVLLTACAATRLAAPIGEPVADPSAFASEIQRSTLPDSPRQITFSWTLNERGSNVNGRGVVRVEAPDRIRLDLFGPRGETYLMAALVNAEYRFPPGMDASVSLPSPALLWSALGIVDPPPAATLMSATRGDSSAELRYGIANGETFVYTLAEPDSVAARLERLERAGTRGIIESIALERDAAGDVSRAEYRNWLEYRDLTLDIESVQRRASFPENIWRPDGNTP